MTNKKDWTYQYLVYFSHHKLFPIDMDQIIILWTWNQYKYIKRSTFIEGGTIYKLIEI